MRSRPHFFSCLVVPFKGFNISKISLNLLMLMLMISLLPPTWGKGTLDEKDSKEAEVALPNHIHRLLLNCMFLGQYFDDFEYKYVDFREYLTDTTYDQCYAVVNHFNHYGLPIIKQNKVPIPSLKERLIEKILEEIYWSVYEAKELTNYQIYNIPKSILRKFRDESGHTTHFLAEQYKIKQSQGKEEGTSDLFASKEEEHSMLSEFLEKELQRYRREVDVNGSYTVSETTAFGSDWHYTTYHEVKRIVFYNLISKGTHYKTRINGEEIIIDDNRRFTNYLEPRCYSRFIYRNRSILTATDYRKGIMKCSYYHLVPINPQQKMQDKIMKDPDSFHSFEYDFEYSSSQDKVWEHVYEAQYLLLRKYHLTTEVLYIGNVPKSLIRAHANTTGLTTFIKEAEAKATEKAETAKKAVPLSHETLAFEFFGSPQAWHRSVMDYLDQRADHVAYDRKYGIIIGGMAKYPNSLFSFEYEADDDPAAKLQARAEETEYLLNWKEHSYQTDHFRPEDMPPYRYVYMFNMPKSLIRAHADQTGLTRFIKEKEGKEKKLFNHAELAEDFFGSVEEWKRSLIDYLDQREANILHDQKPGAIIDKDEK